MRFGRLGSMGAGFGSDGVAPDLSNKSLISVLTSLNLTTGLKLCLDAGDADSYTSGDKWLDVSGGGCDFYLGSDGATAAQKPTFTGTPGGLSSGEYWAFDGGDFFRYDSTNETWMQNLHKNSIATTTLAMLRPAAAGTNSVYGTGANAPNSIVGVTVFINTSTGAGRIRVGTQAGTNVIDVTTNGLGWVDGAWQLVALSFDEAAGAGRWHRNGTATAMAGSYTSPSASTAGYTLEIGALGNGGSPLPNGARLAMFAVWEGRALTALEIGLIFERIRRRFGL